MRSFRNNSGSLGQTVSAATRTVAAFGECDAASGDSGQDSKNDDHVRILWFGCRERLVFTAAKRRRRVRCGSGDGGTDGTGHEDGAGEESERNGDKGIAEGASLIGHGLGPSVVRCPLPGLPTSQQEACQHFKCMIVIDII
jgi:hypothetical protein